MPVGPHATPVGEFMMFWNFNSTRLTTHFRNAQIMEWKIVIPLLVK